MNEGSESNAVEQLLIAGCASYLDVIHATNTFQTRICHAACDLINAAHDRISKIAKLDKPSQAPAGVYVYPTVADNNFDGSQAWVGATIWLDRPVHALLYLALVFHCEPNSDQQTAHICFALQVQAKYLIKQHGDIFRRHPDCKVYDHDWAWLAVELRRPSRDPLSVREELAKILDDALKWWDNATANPESA